MVGCRNVRTDLLRTVIKASKPLPVLEQTVNTYINRFSRPVTIIRIDDVLLGLAMRDLRTHRGYSLRKLAHKMSISVPYLSDLELGRRKWSEAKIRDYIVAIGPPYEPLELRIK